MYINAPHLRSTRAAIARPPTQADADLRAGLDAWVAEAPAEERVSRESLRTKVVEWQGRNAGRAPADTTELDLSNVGLRQLPPLIGSLTNLSKLELSNNRHLAALPPEIGHLANLTELALQGCNVARLPPELRNLQNLRSLSCSHNPLTELPPELCELRNLEKLVASFVPLTRLPAGIGGLSNLQQLSLSCGHLTELPDSIGDLRNLRELDLNNNDFREVPVSLARLENLRKLTLSFNQLTTVPVELSQLRNLTHLSLNHNPIVALPEAVLDLALTCDVPSNGLPVSVIGALQARAAQRAQALAAVSQPRIEAPRQVPFSQALAGIAGSSIPDWAARPRGRVNLPPPRMPQFAPPRAQDLPRIRNALLSIAPVHAQQHQPPAFVISPEARRALSMDKQGQPIRHAASFFSWLDRTMSETKDGRDPTTRALLTKQLDDLVKDLLEDVRLGDSDLRALCFTIADDALVSCGDGAVHGVNDMHVAIMNAKALRVGVDEKTLIGLGIDKFVLALIENEAQQKIAELARNSGRPGDEVETRLFFQTQLREPLAHSGIAVPLPVQGMLFAGAAGVSGSDIVAAAGRISKAYHDGHSKAEFLAEWPPLTRYVENTCTDKFAAVIEKFGARGETLRKQKKHGEITDQAYLEGMNALKFAFEAKNKKLRRQLVAKVVARNLPGEAAR